MGFNGKQATGGALAGAGTGAAIGSAIPGIGTAVGGALGGLTGFLGGGLMSGDDDSVAKAEAQKREAMQMAAGDIGLYASHQPFTQRRHMAAELAAQRPYWDQIGKSGEYDQFFEQAMGAMPQHGEMGPGGIMYVDPNAFDRTGYRGDDGLMYDQNGMRVDPATGARSDPKAEVGYLAEDGFLYDMHGRRVGG